MIRRATRERFGRILALAMTSLFVNTLFPIIPVNAKLMDTPVRAAVGPILAVGNPHAVLKPADPIPEPPAKAKRVIHVRTSAYSSTRDQTDGDPFTTASGMKVHDGTLAMNCLPFGTKVRISSHFGQKTFTVEDRMAKRWGCNRADIWMPSRELAMQWGVRTVTLEIL